MDLRQDRLVDKEAACAYEVDLKKSPLDEVLDRGREGPAIVVHDRVDRPLPSVIKAGDDRKLVGDQAVDGIGRREDVVIQEEEPFILFVKGHLDDGIPGMIERQIFNQLDPGTLRELKFSEPECPSGRDGAA